MACGLSHQLLWLRSSSLQTNSPSKTQTLVEIPNCSCRLRTLKSTHPRNSNNTSLQSSPEESKPTTAIKRDVKPLPDPPSGFSFFDSFSIRLRRLRYLLSLRMCLLHKNVIFIFWELGCFYCLKSIGIVDFVLGCNFNHA